MVDKKVVNLKIALAKKGWTQTTLAREIGVTRAAVSAFIKSLQVGHPHKAVLAKYAKALDIDVKELM